jgi:hypothetical protein
MKIVSKSLHHSNIVFVFEAGKLVFLDNSNLLSIYKQSEIEGANFVDDTALKIKILNLPKLKIQIVVEPDRLIIDDNSQAEPNESNLIWQAAYIYWNLVRQFKLTGFGFNFDIYYKFNETIPMQEIFLNLANKKILEDSDLLDWGMQFSLDKKSKQRDQYFMKIISPMEISVRLNNHFTFEDLPILPPNLGENDELKKERIIELQNLFINCYNKADEVISNLKLN